MKRRIKTLIASGVLACALSGAALAGSLGDGDAALRHYEALRPLAEQGDAVAQAELGSLYHQGRGVAQNYAQAVLWYREAADQGNAVAQFSLGELYGMGREGVGQNNILAYMWLRLAVGRAETADERDVWVVSRDFIAGRMAIDQIAQAQQLTNERLALGSSQIK